MYPKQATRPEFAKFDRNTATNRRGAGIRNRRNAGTGAERFALLAFAKLENVATRVVVNEIFNTFVLSNRSRVLRGRFKCNNAANYCGVSR